MADNRIITPRQYPPVPNASRKELWRAHVELAKQAQEVANEAAQARLFLMAVVKQVGGNLDVTVANIEAMTKPGTRLHLQQDKEAGIVRLTLEEAQLTVEKPLPEQPSTIVGADASPIALPQTEPEPEVA